MVAGVRDVDGPVDGIDRHIEGAVEGCSEIGPIAGPLHARTRHRGHRTARRDESDPVVARVGNVDVAIMHVDCQPVWVVKLGALALKNQSNKMGLKLFILGVGTILEKGERCL